MPPERALEPIEIHCPACGKPVTLWAPDPALEVPCVGVFSGDLDGWACPWCKARHSEETRDVLFFAMTGHRAAEIRELLRFAEADSVTLPDECTNCGGVVMVRMTEVKRHRRFITPGSWVCPYCQKVHGGEFAGRIEWVRKGHEEPSFE